MTFPFFVAVFGIIVGSQNLQENKATGLIRLSNSWKALDTANLLYLYKSFEIANHARLALSKSPLTANCLDPDGLRLIPRYIVYQ